MTTTTEAGACHLALTLLHGDEACPRCGSLAVNHSGWQHERERGGLPSSSSRGRVVLVANPPHPSGEMHAALVERVGPECFGGDEYGGIDLDAEPTEAELDGDARAAEAELMAGGPLPLPVAWIAIGQAVERIEVGELVQCDPATGRVKRGTPAEAKPSPSEPPDPPPSPV